MSDWKLIVEAGSEPHAFPLSSRVHLVGSGEQCDLRVPTLDPELFQLWRDDAGYRLVRMQGPGSVLVNGVDQDEVVLNQGDKLDCRGVVLRMDSGGFANGSGAPEAEMPAGAILAHQGANGTGTATAVAPMPALASEPSAPFWVQVAAAAWAAQNGKINSKLRSEWERVLQSKSDWDWRRCTEEILSQAAIDDARLNPVVISLRDSVAKRLIEKARAGVERKRLLARLIVQGMVVLIVGLAMFVGALFVRYSAGFDFNSIFDRCLEGLRGLAGLFS